MRINYSAITLMAVAIIIFEIANIFYIITSFDSININFVFQVIITILAVTLAVHYVRLTAIDRGRRKVFVAPSSSDDWDGKNQVRIIAPNQGLNFVTDREGLIEEISNTINFLEQLKAIAANTFVPANISDIISWQADKLREINNSLREGDPKAAEDYERYLDRALICHPKSTVGAFIADVTKDPSNTIMREVKIRILAFVLFFKTAHEQAAIQPISTPERLAEFFHWAPELKASGQVEVLYELSLNTGKTLAQVKSTKDELDVLKTELIQALNNARSTLRLAPAAQRWKNNANWSFAFATFGLLPFLLILICLPVAVIWNWSEVSATAHKVFYATDPETKEAIKTWQGFFKDAPWATFVFVTVPVLMFAWTLKHFSRIFVQNMNLSADATRRAALADVYTRIVSDPKLNNDKNEITAEQKKIIFEAMFRPRDPRHTDDGIDHSALDKFISSVKGDGK